METWKWINGYVGLYMISDFGRIKSFVRKSVIIMKPHLSKGYYQASLTKDGTTRHYMVHRLVYETFVGVIPTDKEIDHINTIRNDNRLFNLRLCTRKENQNNPLTLIHKSQAKKGDNCVWFGKTGIGAAKHKAVLQLDKDTGLIIKKWYCIADVERELGINHRQICKVLKGKRISTGGFKWKYV